MNQKCGDVNGLNGKPGSAAFMSGILALDPGLDDVGGTADAGSDAYCSGGAVCGAGAAFHAAVCGDRQLRTSCIRCIFPLQTAGS